MTYKTCCVFPSAEAEDRLEDLLAHEEGEPGTLRQEHHVDGLYARERRSETTAEERHRGPRVTKLSAPDLLFLRPEWRAAVGQLTADVDLVYVL